MTDIPDGVIATIRRCAANGLCSGRDSLSSEKRYYSRCTHFHWRTGTLIMFTRDTGHHSSGWMKNPEYERCRHLSLSFRRPWPERGTHELATAHALAGLGAVFPLAPFDERVADAWVQAIHGDDRRYAWIDGAFSPEGRALSVRHWRVFCDPVWKAILPRGEVYSKELTERGWKSWSELHPEPNWVNAE